MTPLSKLLPLGWILAVFFILSAGANVCSAQHGPMSYGNSYGAYQPVASGSIDQMYRSNETLPLGGLFAKGFTRTATLMGGFNFVNSLDSTGVSVDSEDGSPFFPNIFSDPETGYAVSFAFGRRHSYKLRSEIELAARGNDLYFSPAGEENTINAYSVMKNFIHDFNNGSRFTPYVGAGLGWSYLDLEESIDGVSEGVGAFSYQAIGGVAIKLNRAVDLVAEYRFLGTSEVEPIEFLPIQYEAHNLFLGLKLEY